MKKNISASVIIPVYNQTKYLYKLLSTLKQQEQNLEIIVVDDASKDNLKNIVKKYGAIYKRLDKNLGPANARNWGAKISKGKILIFLDADVIPLKDSLNQGLKKFIDPNVKAVSGFWKGSHSKNFFSQYKDLRDSSYYFNEASKIGQYYFNTRAGMIRKKLFIEIGGFCTKYKKADLESFEFSFRLFNKTKISFAEKFIVIHNYQGFYPLVKNYFKRTYYFLEIFYKYRQFGKVVATKSEAFSVSLAAVILFLLIISIISNSLWRFLIIIIACYTLKISSFLSFVFKNKGLAFTIKALLINIFLHWIIFSASLYYFIRKSLYKIFH